MQENVLHVLCDILTGVFFDDEKIEVIVVDGLLFFNILFIPDDVREYGLSFEFEGFEVASQFASCGDISLGDLLNLFKRFNCKDQEVEKPCYVLALIFLVLLLL
jgi:hypothetical protein